MVGDPHGRRYQILDLLGHGAFGNVYRSRLIAAGGFEKMVAIKLLNQDMETQQELCSRLRDEARMLGLVRHQAIVHVDGLLTVGGRWGVVMECVDGLDLHQILQQTTIPPRAALEIIGELAAALEVAWRTRTPRGEPLRLIHRDIKPSNVKITAAGEVKMLDFGIARAEFGAREARTSLRSYGTKPYMSPERFRFEDGAAGDVYALGVLLFECITRRKLYEGECHQDPDLHHERVLQAQDVVWDETRHVSEALVRFLGELLAFEPSRRPSAEDVARRCDVLVDQLDGLRLRAWARSTVPQIREPPRVETADPMIGVVLQERSGPIPIPAPRRSGREGRLLLLALLFFGLVVGSGLLTAALVALAIHLWERPSAAPPPAPVAVEEPLEPAPEAAGDPAPTATVEASSSSHSAEQAVPTPSLSSPRSPAPEQTAEPSHARAPSPRSGTGVQVSSKRPVTLSASVGGRAVPLPAGAFTSLPAGEHLVTATFEETGRKEVFLLKVRKGDTAGVACDSRTCRQAL